MNEGESTRDDERKRERGGDERDKERMHKWLLLVGALSSSNYGQSVVEIGVKSSLSFPAGRYPHGFNWSNFG